MINIVFWPYGDRLEGRLPLFEEAFPKDTCRWVNRFTDFHDECDGAIVIINGAAQLDDLKSLRELNDSLRLFRWVMVISIGDEGSGLHLEWLEHPNMSIWVFDSKPGKHDDFHHLPAGPLQIPFQNNVKILDWFFSGSVRDIIWDKNIRELPGDGKYYSSHLGYVGYAEHLAMAKITVCRPSWTSPETCRVYDALESGSIPIVGIYPSENPPGHCWWHDRGYDWNSFWPYTLGEKPPFPVIRGPNDLADMVRQTLNEWPENGQRVHAWWVDYKARLIAKLQAEVRRLQG